MTDQSKLWEEFHIHKKDSNHPIWPIEVMVKVLFGDYLSKNKPVFNKESQILDVGCGFGNNLLPFLINGSTCSGTEITEQICEVTKDSLSERGFLADIRKGDNRNLPFQDEKFDLLLSNGVIHYESNEENYLSALKEYSRVLKPGGFLYLMTTGPDHDLYKNSKPLGSGRYLIQDWDFREGSEFFFVSNFENLTSYLSCYFTDIEVGRDTQFLMGKTIDSFLCFGKKI